MNLKKCFAILSLIILANNEIFTELLEYPPPNFCIAVLISLKKGLYILLISSVVERSLIFFAEVSLELFCMWMLLLGLEEFERVGNFAVSLTVRVFDFFTFLNTVFVHFFHFLHFQSAQESLLVLQAYFLID